MPIPAKRILGLLLGLALPTAATADNPAPVPRADNTSIKFAQMQGGGMRQGQGRRQGQGIQGQGQGMSQNQRGGPRQRGGVMAQMGAPFSMVDADGNGAVTGAELLEWHDTVFDAMDVDGDDALTREEFMAVQMGPGADPSQRGPRYDEMQAAKAAEFDAMDRDGNGMVTRTQFTDATAARFLGADANQDGALTQTEFRAMHGSPARTAP
jgi:Ca2+-binding EF-hand superfamily protein